MPTSVRPHEWRLHDITVGAFPEQASCDVSRQSA